MTQVKLWQIVSQTTNGIVFSDSNGNLVSLPQGAQGQVLIINAQGVPEWVANTALSTALEAKTDAAAAIATANAYTEAQIAALVDNAPVALNTLNELAVKLNGEDSAINALLVQVDGKAEKTEVTTQVAQAKQDAILDSKAYTDTAVSTSEAATAVLIATAKTEAITTAAADATTKANNAKVAAINDASAYTDDAVLNATAGANSYAEGLVNAAKTEVTIQAQNDASNRVNALRQSIPGSFRVETTSVASYVSDSTILQLEEVTGAGAIVKQKFNEITGANIGTVDDTLSAKMLLVNGVAQATGWTTESAAGGTLLLKISPALAAHVFDGTNNAVMLLVEYKKYSSISLIPAE